MNEIMMYQLTGANAHLDFGFGITGESYYESAKYLDENKHAIGVFQLVEMPINFCYRHSIELFLKSLIIIFHKKLNISYNTFPPTSTKPMIQVNGKWRMLYTCHWIGELYKYWKDSLLLANLDKLQKIATKGQWLEDIDITSAIDIIAKYDKQSSFFRYPVTENANLDLKKFAMEEMDIESLTTLLSERKELDISTEDKNNVGKIILAMKNEDGDISTTYVRNENVLEEISIALKKVAYYFYCIHIMVRCTLCNGN